jgi:hypothetical protein
MTNLKIDPSSILDDNATVAWDSTVYDRLFGNSPADMLAVTDWNPGYLIKICLRQKCFTTPLAKICADDKVEATEVLRSVSRTLFAALRNR